MTGALYQNDRFNPLPMPETWVWCAFPVEAGQKPGYRWGSARRYFGVHRVGPDRYLVTHLPSGRHLTEFTRLRFARRFCEAIELLADWSKTPTITRKLDKVLDTTARRVAGLPPRLVVLEGGAR